MSPASDRTKIVSEEAASWYIRCIDEPDMGLEDRRELLAWLKRSPENIAEMLRILDTGGLIAGSHLRDRAGELQSGSNVIDIRQACRAARRHHQSSDKAHNKVNGKAHEKVNGKVRDKSSGKASGKTSGKVPTRRRKWSIWSKVAAAAVASTALLLGIALYHRVPEGVVQTAASQRRNLKLDDGSVAYLDARTRLRVELTAEQRIVHLERGWVVFDVAKDHSRPFIVRTATVDVTAVGTRFGVAVDQGVTTTVEEGTVKVTTRGKQDGAPVFLHKGQELFVPDAGMLMFSKPVLSESDIVEVDAGRKLMWVSGHVQLIDTNIGEIVRQFNRRHELQVEIDDAAIADRRVDLAIMHVDSVSDFIDLMESRGVTVTRSGSTLVLRARSE